MANVMNTSCITSSPRLWAIFCLLLVLQPGCATAMERRQITFDNIRDEARSRASTAYSVASAPLPEKFRAMSYDDYRRINFRRDRALWTDGELPFRVQLFHRGYLFQDPVFIHEFTDTHVQELPYVRDFFRFGDLEINEFPRRNSGYAGWRLLAPLNTEARFDEVIAFLGASYFRALGRNQVYGLSARGLLLPHEPGQPEEFPQFVEFWLRKPEPGSESLLVYALLDSPSVTGAYQFEVIPGDPTQVKVLATLYPRVRLDSIGLGALTSMFYYGENTWPKPNDFRPEVHDSDGLMLQYYGNDYRWRPLNARAEELTTRFEGVNLRAFSLSQRDRDIANYLDTETQYHNRPSARMRLGTGFSDGSVVLRELTPENEFADNIVASYVPAQVLEPGNAYQFDFVLEWGNFSPPESLATVLSTRQGQDLHNKSQEFFHVEFNLPDALREKALLPVVTTSPNARVEQPTLSVDRENGRIRAGFQVVPEGDGVVHLSLHLEDGGERVSETWLYQWINYN